MTQDDLSRALDEIAGTICESLGFGVAVFNLYRPAWDDFVASTIHAPNDVREALLGSIYPWRAWDPVLDERFRRRGAYVLLHGSFDWRGHEGTRYVQDLPAPADPAAWHPEDEIFVPCFHSDGHLLAVLNVGQPASGLRPSDEELDALVVIAKYAARAVESAQEAAVAADHRRALEELLHVSSHLARTLTLESVLETTCDGISRALGFQHVTAHTLGSNGLTAPIAAVDMAVNDPAINGGLTEAQLVELLTSEFEVEGCYLLPLEAVTARVELPEGIYRSKLNGRGPRAWNRHWLIVPLRDYAGELIGVVAADDPADRLLPSRERLQALRLFVNQAAAALEALNRFEEVRTLAERDPLTRLFNRRAFVHRLVTEAAHCQRHGMPLALVFYDLDEFKQINDSYGHDAGDRELIRFGSMLIEATRAEDEVFRYGGDEFALLLPNCREDEAAAVTARVAAALVPTALSASFGVAVAEPDDANSVDTLLRAADTAMYASKRRASVAV